MKKKGDDGASSIQQGLPVARFGEGDVLSCRGAVRLLYAESFMWVQAGL